MLKTRMTYGALAALSAVLLFAAPASAGAAPMDSLVAAGAADAGLAMTQGHEHCTDNDYVMCGQFAKDGVVFCFQDFCSGLHLPFDTILSVNCEDDSGVHVWWICVDLW